MRTGTYHKQHGGSGRSWYIEVQGERPTVGESASITRRDGRSDTVTITEVTGQQSIRGNWICKFKHSNVLANPNSIIASQALGEDEPSAPVDSTIPTDADDAAMDIATALARLLAGQKVQQLIDAAIERAKLPQVITYVVQTQQAQGPLVTVEGTQHESFAHLLTMCAARVNVQLVGPAASGKTTAAEQVAQALGLPFEYSSQLQQSFEATGYMDAMGKFHETPFYRMYKGGGVFLADEADGWDANAFLALNAALANRFCVFPNGELVKQHPDFVCIAAMNTYGLGADFSYVGRNKLDDSTIDRFVTLVWEHSNAIEDAAANNPAWVAKIRAWRAAAKAKGIKVLITARASIFGARLLAQGLPEDVVIAATVRKGMDTAQWDSIKGAAQ
jgi:cobaltochelatase CobS